MTGSGRSARKTGRRAPSARSGCRLSDCFLETHTYIHIQTQKREEKKKMGRLASPIPSPQKASQDQTITEDHLLRED